MAKMTEEWKMIIGLAILEVAFTIGILICAFCVLAGVSVIIAQLIHNG